MTNIIHFMSEVAVAASMARTHSGSSDDTRSLAVLHETNAALAGAATLRAGLERVLRLLGTHLAALESFVALKDPGGGVLRVEAAEGRQSFDAADYRLGDGVVGRVAHTGRPVVVPRMSQEPALRHPATGSLRLPASECSLVCVPVLLARQPVGVIACIFRYRSDRDFERLSKLLGLVASMVAQAIRLERVIAAERQRLGDENASLRQELAERYDFANVLGSSSGLRDVLQRVAQVAQSDATVLIRGESGTGKELIAHAIHYGSHRGRRAFVKVSCAALPETLVESELFGYERGAFTGAAATKKGRFELAEGGTLFLDEIGELSPATQVKLLRVFQERELERLGGTETIKVNVRLVTATNRDLEQALAGGAFREDLYYRLNVFAIFIPPLRERKSDVPLLADHFLLALAREHRKTVKRISTAAIDLLMSYHWPGNVRELQNAIGHAVLVCDGGVVHPHHLPPTLQTAETSDTASYVPLAQAVAAYEKDLIQDALKSAKGNRARAARTLGLTERMIGYKVRKHRIDWRRFRRW